MILKKVAIIFLLVIYGFSSIGATVHLHYCMGKFVDWSLIETKEDKCDKCGMKGEVRKACCKDEHKHFKLKADQQKGSIVDAVNFITTAVFLAPISYSIFQIPANTKYNYSNYHPPPDIFNQNLQVLYCTFLI